MGDWRRQETHHRCRSCELNVSELRSDYEADGPGRIESISSNGGINHAGDERRMMRSEKVGGRNLYFFKLPGPEPPSAGASPRLA